VSRSRLLAGLLAAPLLVASAGSALDTTASSTVEPARLVFLLEYVGTDYGKAVHDGHVINQAEYGEALRVSKQLIREYERRFNDSPAVTAGLTKLLQLIERRAPGEQVFETTRALLPEFSSAVNSAVKLTAQPNLANGARLWSSDCVTCHGPTGHGDGADTERMDPRPTSFLELDKLSPRRVYGAVTYGIDGTAMPSFVAAYSEAQRWDVAFFVMTLRDGFKPAPPAIDPGISLDEVAVSSNAELLARLRQKVPDASASAVDYLRANSPAAGGDNPARGTDDGGSSPLATALQLQEVFASVADRVFPRVVGLRSYVRDSNQAATPRVPQNDSGHWTALAPPAPAYYGFRVLRSGTGIALDDGYVLSRDFLVRDARGDLAQFVSIELPDGSDRLGRIVGTEPMLDFAVLRFADPAQFPVFARELDIGDSDRVKAGHWLIALGDPPGVERIFTVGMVSAAPARQCYQDLLSATMLQCSITVPAAGLGGPVVDILGRVVGISVSPATFADPSAPSDTPTRVLPINLAMNLFEPLRTAESHASPWIGVSVLELQSYRSQFPDKAPQAPWSGVYIDNLFDPSPASRAGVRLGDFLLEIGGHRLGSVADFQKWMYVLGVGTSCDLKLWRDGKPISITVTIEPRPAAASTR